MASGRSRKNADIGERGKWVRRCDRTNHTSSSRATEQSEGRPGTHWPDRHRSAARSSSWRRHFDSHFSVTVIRSTRAGGRGWFSCFFRQPFEFIQTEKSFSPPSEPPVFFSAVLPTGNAVRDGVSWGRTGASGDGLTWPAARGGSVQGFPCRHYGRCVLDEHIGGTGEGRPPACRGDVRRKCLDIATAGTEQRNGREQKSPAGRGSCATY